MQSCSHSIVKIKSNEDLAVQDKKHVDLPEGPKFSTNPSTQPDIHSALLTIFARKKRVPIEPPNSGPKVLLIMTKCLCQGENE